MIVHLVRHTRVNLPQGICYGQSDVPVMDNWEVDAQHIKQKFDYLDEPLVYSSPLIRCRLLAEKLSTRVNYDNRLKELNFGDWELKPWDEISGAEAENWMNNFVITPCPNGESYLDLYKRVKSFLNELSNCHDDEVIIVTHGGVIRAFVCMIQNIPLHKSFEINVNHGQITSLALP